MKRNRPIYWNETNYLVRMASDPHSVQAIQRRDRIAAYLGIEPWEWKDQL